MNETEVRAAVQKFIDENSLNARIVECEFDYDDSSKFDVCVEVDRKDYYHSKTLDQFFNDFSIRWKQKTPELVAAELGDLVLIFDQYHGDDDESSVGLVSSKSTKENGDIYYGCRYIQIGLHNQFVNQMYDFRISEENFGGYPIGFLKILTPEEAIAHLKAQLDIAAKEELKAIQAKFERSTKNLPRLIESLQKTEKIFCEKIETTAPFFASLAK